MSLSISIITTYPSGDLKEATLLSGELGLAGAERTRTLLWGSQAIKALGATFLPQLANHDLWVPNAELARFGIECSRLLDHVKSLTVATPWDEEYITQRLNNFIDAIAKAEKVRGGVLID